VLEILSMVRTANETCLEGDFFTLPPEVHRPGVVKGKQEKDPPLCMVVPPGEGACTNIKGSLPGGITEGITAICSAT